MDEMDDHSEAVISRFYRPLASELDDMEEVLENWFKVLSYDERVLVFKRTSGQTWKVLSRSYKMTRSWLTVKYRRCLKKIFDYVMERQNIQDREAV